MSTPATPVLPQRYYDHHFNCPHCIAAGMGAGRGQRCAQGQQLWQGYINELLHTPVMEAAQ